MNQNATRGKLVMIKHAIGTVIDTEMIEEIVTEIAEVTVTEIVNAREIRLVTVRQRVTECVTLSLQKKNGKIRVKATQMGLKKQVNNNTRQSIVSLQEKKKQFISL